MLRGTDRHRDRADARDFLGRSRAGGEERGSPEPQMEPFARAARSQGRTAAQPRGLDRTAAKRKLAANSPPHLQLHTPLSLPLERDRLHARGGARKAKGTCSATAFFLRLPCPDWLDGGSRLASSENHALSARVYSSSTQRRSNEAHAPGPISVWLCSSARRATRKPLSTPLASAVWRRGSRATRYSSARATWQARLRRRVRPRPPRTARRSRRRRPAQRRRRRWRCDLV
jgi:hypothetical protein